MCVVRVCMWCVCGLKCRSGPRKENSWYIHHYVRFMYVSGKGAWKPDNSEKSETGEVHTQTHTHTHKYTHTLAHSHTRTHTHTHTLAHIHTHTHAHTRTHTVPLYFVQLLERLISDTLTFVRIPPATSRVRKQKPTISCLGCIGLFLGKYVFRAILNQHIDSTSCHKAQQNETREAVLKGTVGAMSPFNLFWQSINKTIDTFLARKTLILCPTAALLDKGRKGAVTCTNSIDSCSSSIHLQQMAHF